MLILTTYEPIAKIDVINPIIAVVDLK